MVIMMEQGCVTGQCGMCGNFFELNDMCYMNKFKSNMCAKCCDLLSERVFEANLPPDEIAGGHRSYDSTSVQWALFNRAAVDEWLLREGKLPTDAACFDADRCARNLTGWAKFNGPVRFACSPELRVGRRWILVKQVCGVSYM